MRQTVGGCRPGRCIILPRIETTAGKLIAQTPWLAYAGCFGAYSCKVVADSANRELTLERRILWIFKTKRTIPFRAIECIAYNYQGPRSQVGRLLSDSTDESFTVGLRLDNLDYVHLFHFSGFWEEEAKAYATELAKMTGATLGR